MINSIQRYSWGSLSAISELLGVDPPGKPEAELWMGAHPKAPSRIETENGPKSLLEAIGESPLRFLGSAIVEGGGSSLPFLFKVLAADQALSIQAHPNLEQAIAGFDREEREGVPIDAPDRNYRDSNHKPEVMCALTDFWALSGFRSAEEIRKYFGNSRDALAIRATKALGSGDEQGYRSFLNALLNSNRGEQSRCIHEVAGTLPDGDESRWVSRLGELYRDDIGVLAPLFLNLLCLAPGDAAYLGAGILHAYLSGVGIELMANSDNVLRGGLTQKHIDIGELERILVFESFLPQIERAEVSDDGIAVYENGATDFELRRVEPELAVTGKVEFKPGAPAIAIVTQGSARFGSGEDEIVLPRGRSVYLLPEEDVEITGSATLYLATMPG